MSAVEAGTGDAGQQVPDMPVVRTIPIADPGDLVGRLPGPEAVAWIPRGEGLVGGVGGSGPGHPACGRRQVYRWREVAPRPVRRSPDRRPGRPARIGAGGLRELHLRSHL